MERFGGLVLRYDDLAHETSGSYSFRNPERGTSRRFARGEGAVRTGRITRRPRTYVGNGGARYNTWPATEITSEKFDGRACGAQTIRGRPPSSYTRTSSVRSVHTPSAHPFRSIYPSCTLISMTTSSDTTLLVSRHGSAFSRQYATHTHLPTLSHFDHP